MQYQLFLLLTDVVDYWRLVSPHLMKLKSIVLEFMIKMKAIQVGYYIAKHVWKMVNFFLDPIIRCISL